MTATDTIAAYFTAFNAGDTDAMLACLAEDIAHHVNEGNIRTGKPATLDRDDLRQVGVGQAADLDGGRGHGAHRSLFARSVSSASGTRW